MWTRTFWHPMGNTRRITFCIKYLIASLLVWFCFSYLFFFSPSLIDGLITCHDRIYALQNLNYIPPFHSTPHVPYTHIQSGVTNNLEIIDKPCFYPPQQIFTAPTHIVLVPCTFWWVCDDCLSFCKQQQQQQQEGSVSWVEGLRKLEINCTGEWMWGINLPTGNKCELCVKI